MPAPSIASIPREETAIHAELFPMSPMQQAMLYGSLQAPGSGVNVEQLVIKLEPDIDAAALGRAVQELASRFLVFRSSFRWAPEPAMVVQREVVVPFSEVEDGERAAFLAEDRSQPFDFAQAPLARFTLLTGGTRPELVCTFHHALLDGRSFAPMLQVLFTVYAALRAGQPLPYPSPDRFGKYLLWQAALDHSGSREFWRQTFAGLEKPEPLRGPKPNPPQSGQGVLTRHWPGLGNACATAAQRFGVTSHTVIQGAWALLLSHYTRAAEVVFGSVRAGRHSDFPNAECIIGLLINTVPLRISLPIDATLADWLRQLRAQHLAIRPHEQTPLHLVHEWSGQPAGEPLFDTLLAFENHELDDLLRAEDPSWRDRETELHEQTGFPVTLNVIATEHLRCQLSFDRARFDDAFAEGLLAHFNALLVNLLGAAEDTPLRAIPMLPAGERAKMLSLNQADGRASSERSLTRWFEAQVIATPNAVALSYEGSSLTYTELNAQANALARQLRKAGIGGGQLVAICLPRSPQTVVAMLGVLKAGAGYVPLESSIPSDRLAYILEDTQAAVLLTDATLLETFPAATERALCHGQDWPKAAQDHSNLDESPDSDAPAYIIYTSGSTGQPKGVVVAHRQVVRLMESTEAWFQFGPHDVWTFFHSFAFDFSVWELWGALLYGGRLVIVPHLLSRTPDAFHALLVQEQVTVLNQTPSAFRQLMAIDEAQPKTAPLALRYVIFGGEALDPTHLAGWFARHGDQQPRLVNMYGITETTVHVTYRPLTKNDAACSRSVIGCPLPDLSLYVLDRFGEPCPLGVAGELHVGGAGLAQGYLHQPELTAERFTPDPFSDNAGARLYHTGDLVRYLADGDLEYLGRIDSQVKLRGFRIELGEIENALRAHPAVREAVVVAAPGGETRLAAYYLSPSAPEPDELRAWLRRSLPEYMVPASFTALERWPLTANGKLDRARLPQPVESPASPAPQRSLSPLESAIATAWCAVLGLEAVDVHRNFFDSGGDSLRLLQVWARLQESVAPGLPMVALFAHPTVAELASHLSGGLARPTVGQSAAAARQQAALRNQRALRQRTLL